MYAKHLSLILGAGCVLSAGPFARATPLVRADLPADPVWMAHIDFDVLRPTAIGRYVLSELEKPAALEKIQGLQAITGVDLRKQVRAATLWGPSSRPEDAAVVIYGDFDSERLIALAKALSAYEPSNHGAHVIHSWVDENKTDKSGKHPECTQPSRVRG